MGDSSGDEDGGGVDGEAFRGHFPVPAACRNRDSCPPDLGFAMAAAVRAGRLGGGFLFRLQTPWIWHATETDVVDASKSNLGYPLPSLVQKETDFSSSFLRKRN
jgi:hypothetical protein